MLATLVASAVLLVGAFVNVVEQIGVQQTSSEELETAINLNAALRRVEIAITDAETSQRGFLLTGDPAYLDPLERALRKLEDAFVELRHSWADAGQQNEAADRLAEVLESKKQELLRAVSLTREGRRDAALAVVRSNLGQLLMAETRQRIEAMRATALDQRAIQLKRVNEAQAGVARILALIALLAVTVFVTLVVGLLRVRRTEAARLAEIRSLAAAANRANAQLERARDEALAATLAKSRFLAAASHDMRQPLHALSLFASALERRVSGEEATRLLANLQQSIRSMQGMFSALLDLSRIEAGAMVPRMERVVLAPLLAAIATEFGALAAEKGLRLVVVPSRIRLVTDPQMLEACLRNLVSNAVKFTTSGRVLVGVRMRAGQAVIEVHDTGPGIPADRLDDVFEEFERLGRTRNAGDDGLGLGLSIVRRTAELLGIEVGVRSRAGAGSCFSLVLPETARRAGTSDDPAIEAALHHAPRPGIRLLVLDDDPVVREAVRADLSDRGYAVTLAASPEEARSLGLDFDGFLLDLDLGGEEDGLDFARACAARADRPIPSLILTGSTDRKALNRLEKSGYPWLVKPASPDVLAGRLARMVAGPA